MNSQVSGKPSVTLHIGTKKTGSTALQVYLQDHQNDLSEAGWTYPDFLENRNHFLLALLFATETSSRLNREHDLVTVEQQVIQRQKFAEQLREQVRPGQRWIFSSEMFSARLQTVEEVQALADFLDQFFGDVQIIVYLRRQDFMIPSTYSQSVREGSLSSLDLRYIERRRVWFDHLAQLERWVKVFGQDKVIVRPYLERYKRGSKDLLSDFFTSLNTDIVLHPQDRTGRASKNDRLSAEGARFMNLINWYFIRAGIPEAKRSAHLRGIAARIDEFATTDPFLPSAQLCEQVRQSFAAENQQLIEMVGQGPLWQEWLDQEPEVAPADPPLITSQRFAHLLFQATDFENPESASMTAQLIYRANLLRDIDWYEPDQPVDLPKPRTFSSRVKNRLRRALN